MGTRSGLGGWVVGCTVWWGRWRASYAPISGEGVEPVWSDATYRYQGASIHSPCQPFRMASPECTFHLSYIVPCVPPLSALQSRASHFSSTPTPPWRALGQPAASRPHTCLRPRWTYRSCCSTACTACPWSAASSRRWRASTGSSHTTSHLGPRWVPQPLINPKP